MNIEQLKNNENNIAVVSIKEEAIKKLTEV